MKKWLAIGFAILVVLVVGLAAAFQYSRSWANALFIDPIYQFETTEKVVALTFDDGPSPVRTPPLLALLEVHNVKATFFMVGANIEQYPDVAQQVFDAGHLIGNHSYDHPRLYFRPPDFIREQVLSTDRLIQALGQTDVQYFRPPYTAKFIVLPLVLRDLGKSLVTGTYDPLAQYETPLDARRVADQILANVTPGTIIYLHDGKSSDADAFVEAVELTITGLTAQGYSFVTLDYAAQP